MIKHTIGYEVKNKLKFPEIYEFYTKFRVTDDKVLIENLLKIDGVQSAHVGNSYTIVINIAKMFFKPEVIGKVITCLKGAERQEFADKVVEAEDKLQFAAYPFLERLERVETPNSDWVESVTYNYNSNTATVLTKDESPYDCHDIPIELWKDFLFDISEGESVTYFVAANFFHTEKSVDNV